MRKTQPESILALRVRLTIPDNEARTAYSSLRRLGVNIQGLQRADLYILNSAAAQVDAELAARHDESIFNENMHALSIAPVVAPASGELWVIDHQPRKLSLGACGQVFVVCAWSLVVGDESPAPENLLANAAQLLLCNPAVQRRIHHVDELLSGERTTR